MSNLLEKASILLTPTAYDDGKILSVKPEEVLGSELMPSIATIANLGGGFITQITENIYSSTSDGTSGSAVRPKFDFNTTAGKTYKLVITPIGTITGTINFDFYDGSTYLFQDYDFTTIKEITFTDNGTVFGAFNGQLAYSISNFKVSIKEEIDGDFDFTRNSSATRVNSQGLIEDMQILSGDLITNGDFATDSDWGKINSTISGGTGNLDGDGQTSLLFQDILTNGKTYKVTFTVSDYNSLGNNDIINNNGVALYVLNSNGTFTFTFTHSDANGTIYWRARNGGVFSVDNVSVIEITDDTNLPRIDYSPYSGAGTCGHWLFEPQSTNLFNYSEDLANSYWSDYGNEVSRNLNASQINPIGTSGSYKLEGVSGLRRFGVILTVTPNTDYTLSFYAKNIDATLLKALFSNASLTTYTYTSEVNTTDWSRVEINFTTLTGTSTAIQILRDLPIGESLYLWGLQIEQNSFATSYIPTNGSTVTRLKDAAFGAGNSSLINSTEGVLYVEVAALAEQTLTRYITLSNGASSNRIIIYITDVGVIKFFVGVGGVTQAAKTVSGQTTTNFNKLAVSYKENDIKFYLNGVKVHTDTSASTFPADTLNVLNFAASNGTSSPFFGKANCFAVFKEALTDAELTCLTTI